MTVEQIVQALKSPRVRDVCDEQLLAVLGDVILRDAFSLRRIVPTEEEADAIIRTLHDELRTTYANLRIDEIRIAVRAAVFGQLGTMYGLTPAEFIRMMDAYYSGRKRQDALEMISRLDVRQRPPNPEENERRNREALRFAAIEFYDQVKESGDIVALSTLFVGSVFDFLVSTGAIELSSEQMSLLERHGYEAESKKKILEELFRKMARQECPLVIDG